VPVRNYLLRLLAATSMLATPAVAADQSILPALPWLTPSPPPLATKAAPLPNIEYFMPRPVPAWQAEFGARYWYAEAKTGKSLYGPPSLYDGIVSRLTYRDLIANSGELYGRMASTYGLFIKGYAGLGAISQGTLQDEDFPTPGFSPYSSTESSQHGGYLSYGTVDIGYDVVRGGDFNLGAFAGYTIFKQSVNAFGCAQAAGNPDICEPAISTGIKVITQTNIWQSPRLGANGSLMLGRFTLTADAAWLPYVTLNGSDSHWLRMGTAVGDFTGPIPEDGTGMGYQLEAQLSYNITPNASIGVGARYWHMQTNSGTSHFENMVVGEGALPQPVYWKTDIFGVFIGGSYRFGPYPFAGMSYPFAGVF
jgi:outer membrane protease